MKPFGLLSKLCFPEGVLIFKAIHSPLVFQYIRFRRVTNPSKMSHVPRRKHGNFPSQYFGRCVARLSIMKNKTVSIDNNYSIECTQFQVKITQIIRNTRRQSCVNITKIIFINKFVGQSPAPALD